MGAQSRKEPTRTISSTDPNYQLSFRALLAGENYNAGSAGNYNNGYLSDVISLVRERSPTNYRNLRTNINI